MRVIFKKLLTSMILKYMSPLIRQNELIAFREDLQYKCLVDGFRVSTKYGRKKFNGNQYLKELGEIVNEGKRTGEEIAQYFWDQHLIPQEISLSWLQSLFENGIINEELMFSLCGRK